jgi:hypothetical protein
VFPTVEQLMAQTAADIQWMAQSAWRPYGPFQLAGNWEFPCNNPQDQIISVPVGWVPSFTQYFGPGWLPWGTNQKPQWRTFIRHLNIGHGIDFNQYPLLTPNQQLAWSPYRFQGLPRLR